VLLMLARIHVRETLVVLLLLLLVVATLLLVLSVGDMDVLTPDILVSMLELHPGWTGSMLTLLVPVLLLQPNLSIFITIVIFDIG